MTLQAAIGTVVVGPNTLTGGQLAITSTPATSQPATSPSAATQPAATLTATATGATKVGTTTHPATATFTPTAVVMQTDLGARTIAPGWTLQGVTVLVSDTATSLVPAGATDPDGLPVLLAPNQPIAVGGFTMPTSLTAGGVLPASVTSGMATFDPTQLTAPADAPATYQLAVPEPSNWFVTGTAKTPASLQITAIGYQLNVTGPATSLSAAGLGQATLARVPGAGDTSSPTSLSLALTGQISSNDGGAVLTGTMAAAAGAAWTDVGGVAGFDLNATSVWIDLSSARAPPPRCRPPRRCPPVWPSRSPSRPRPRRPCPPT